MRQGRQTKIVDACKTVNAEAKPLNNLNEMLKKIILTAKHCGIPVSDNIAENVAVNYRATNRFGLCRKTPRGFEIEVTYRLIDADEKSCMTVLAHEVLHTCSGCMNHKKLWKSYAEIMNKALGLNITNTSSCVGLGVEDISKVRYIAVCEKCSVQIKRQRMSLLIKHPERYRCRCGGRFAIIPVEDEKQGGK